MSDPANIPRDPKDVFHLQPAMLVGAHQTVVEIKPMSMDGFGRTAENRIDIEDLVSKMKAVMPDFMEKGASKTGSLGLMWSNEVVYKVGPNSKGGQNKYWTFTLPEVDKTDGSGKFKPIINITTQKGDRSQVSISNTHLTVKRAMMLAVLQHNVTAVEYAKEKPGVYMLTPLASSTFSSKNLPEIAVVMGGQTDEDSVLSALRAVNASTCNGGQNLKDSRGPIAVAAAVAATVGKDPAIQKSIVTSVVRQYTAAGKLESSEDQAKTLALCALANSGVQTGFTHEALLDLWRNGRDLSMRQAAAYSQAQLQAKVDFAAELKKVEDRQAAENAKAAAEKREPVVFEKPTLGAATAPTNLLGDARNILLNQEDSWVKPQARGMYRFPKKNGLD